MTYAPGTSEQTINRVFESVAATRRDATALLADGIRLSFGELDEKANRLAHRLRALGVTRDVPVGICFERSPGMVVAILAVLKAGGAYVPMDPTYPAPRLTWMAEDGGLIAVLADRTGAERLPPDLNRPILVLGRDDESWSNEPASVLPAVNGPDDLAYIIYTSGSTGRPKGVEVPHRGVIRLVIDGGYFPFGPGHVFLHMGSISFDVSTFELWGGLLNGCPCALLAGGLPTPGIIGDAIRRHGVTVAWLTSSLFNTVIDEAPHELRSLRHLLVGGEALSPRHVRRALECLPETYLINGYGPTECTTFACCHAISRDLPADARSVPIGKPIRETTAHILDERMQPVTPGHVGELYLGGSGVARGYRNRPDLTAERFVPDPFSGRPGARLYRTGDLARELPDGTIDYLGRNDDQVKIRGFRIELGEIEFRLREHPSVREAAVLAVPDPAGTGSRLLAAYVAPRGDAPPSVSVLQDYLASNLPPYMVPPIFIFLPALPINPNGKLDRSALPPPEPVRATGSPATIEPPRTPSEILLAGIWRDVLRCPAVGRSDSFLSLGGHSLGAVQVSTRVRERAGRDLPPAILFEEPSLAAVASFLDSAGPAAAGQDAPPPLLPVSRDRRLPLSFAQERVWFLERISPGLRAYEFIVTLRFEGPLDARALQAALDEIVRRHEILRTAFPDSDGEPVQVIHPPGPAPMPVIDLASHPAGDREHEAEVRLRREIDRPFDLARLPLARWALVRMAADDHILLHNEHHIVHDGWSFYVFLRELKTLYQAFAEGRAPDLPQPVVQFADYTVRQREWIESGVGDRQLAFWTRRLAGAPPALELPLDKPRPPVFTFRGRTLRRDWPATLAAGIAETARREGATPYMVMLSVFAALVSKWSGCRDLVIGSGIANRRWRETEDMLGMLINNICLRVDTSGQPTFRELVRRVRATVLEAGAHQDVPFDRVVRAVNPPRDPSRSPLFQVMFTTYDGVSADFDWPGLRLRCEDALSNDTAKFDLNVVFLIRNRDSSGRDAETHDGRRWLFLWEYNRDLFDDTTMRNMADAYEKAAGLFLANPDARISEAAAPAGSAPVAPATGEGGIRPESGSLRALESGSAEPVLLDIWREVLKNPAIGPDDRFFEIGGHSLALLKVHGRIRARLGVDIPVTDLFSHPTVRSLAARLEGRTADGATGAGGMDARARARLQREQREARARRRP